MKAFLSFIISFVAITLCIAQDRGLINRVDPQTNEPSAKRLAADEYFRVLLDQGIKSASPSQSSERSFDLKVFQPTIQIGEEHYGSITGHIHNLTSYPVNLIFKRTQQLPTGWTTGVCFGDLCYSDTRDSLLPEEAYILAGSAQVEFRLNVAILTPSSFPDSVVAYILVSAIGTTVGDTVGLWLKASSEGTQGAVNSSRVSISKTTIRSIYPSPLMSGNNINVVIHGAKELGFRYSIYDPFGREVAFGTSQRKLVSGDNIFNINSLEGFTTGSYLLKLNFSDGSNDTYPFSVLR